MSVKKSIANLESGFKKHTLNHKDNTKVATSKTRRSVRFKVTTSLQFFSRT